MRFAWIVLSCACGASEARTASPQPQPQSPTVAAAVVVDASLDAPDASDAEVARAVAADTQAANDVLLARIASTPLKTISSPPPPPHPPPPPPPTHDLEVRRVAEPLIFESTFRISDGLPFEVVRRIIRQNYGRLRLCYEYSLRSNPAKAKMVVRFAIGRSGDVILAEPLTSDASPELTTCYVRAFQTLSYPQPLTPTLVVVEYGMSLEP
jgi:hypothetical protein